MKQLGLLALIAVSGCATSTESMKVIEQTPASIEIECMSFALKSACSPQEIADLAQAHCQKFKRNALQNMLLFSPSGNRRVTYRCVD